MQVRLSAAVASLSILFAILWNLPDSPLSGAAYGQEATAIHASYNGTAGFNLPIWVLESTDIGRKYGLQIKTSLIGGAQGVHALIGGSFQYSQTGLEHAINAIAQGAEVIALGTSEFGFPYKLVGRKGVSKPEHLKGGVIGVAAFGGTGIFAVRLALAKLGLSENDVKIIVAGNTSQRAISLMVAGGLDATVLSPPSLFKVEKAGLPVLFDIREFSEYPNSSLVTTKSRVEKNRDEVRRFVRAWAEAISFIKRRPQESQAILRKYVRLDDPEIIQGTYKFYAEKLPRSPKVLAKDFAATARLLKAYNPQMKTISYDQVFDMTFIDEMERDGFIQSLYR